MHRGEIKPDPFPFEGWPNHGLTGPKSQKWVTMGFHGNYPTEVFLFREKR